MSKRVQKIVFALLIVFSLCSCSTNDCKEFPLMEGDILLINRENQIGETYESNNPNIVDCLEENFIKANQEGETSVILTYNKKKEELMFKVGSREIREIDEQKNEKIGQELISQIEGFVEKKENENQLTIEERIYTSLKDSNGNKINSLTESKVLKATANPFQIEYETPDASDFLVIRRENGQFFRYEKQNSDKLSRTFYAVNSEEFEQLFEESKYNFDIDELIKFNFNKLNSNTYYNNNFFLVHSYYKESLNDEFKNKIASLCEPFNININSLAESIATIYYQFEKNTITFGTALNIEIDDTNLEIGISYTVSTKEFTMYKITDENATIPRPHNINLVTEKTDLVGKEYQFRSYDYAVPECIMTDFEKGQYIVHPIAGNFHYLDIRIYDKNKKRIETAYNHAYNHTFYIPKKGTYYVELSRKSSELIKIKVEKANYKTIAKLNNPEELKSGEYIIEGFMDIHYFAYNNKTNHNVTLLVKNVGSGTFMFAYELVDHVYEGSVFRYTLKPGVNEFVLSYNIFDVDEKEYPKTYNVEFTIV